MVGKKIIYNFMLNKYNQFILEKKIINLILENDMKASSDFLDKLSSIQSKSKIAEILFKAFDYEEYIVSDLPQNWIDVTDKEDMVSFISDIKADKWMKDNEDSPFIMKGRNEVSIGKFARRLLTDKNVIEDLELGDIKFTDKDFETFVNLYKSTHSSISTKFELVEGEKIREYYLEENYASGKGQLGSSCMRYDFCQDYLNIYVENPESIKLLVHLNQNNAVLGRALVWKLKDSPCEAKYFMDRIYTAADSDIIKFQNYADKEGWLRKYENTSDETTSILFLYKGTPVIGKVVVKLNKSDFSEYPFMDTISCVSPKDKIASNIHVEKSMIECCSTDGEGYECSDCEGSGKYDGECRVCYGEGDTECDECSGRGTTRCNDCRGTGIEIGTQKECEVCNGEGSVLKIVKRTKCKACDGKKMVGKTCEKCQGSGVQDCEFCKGEGTIKCITCKGKGELKGDCPGCKGKYKRILTEISQLTRFGKFHDLAKKALLEVPVEKKVKKKKK